MVPGSIIESTHCEKCVNTGATTVTFTLGLPKCAHMTGVYTTIPKRFWGRREVFLCLECETILDRKTMKKV